RHRELATPLQHDQAPRLNRIQATSTRGVRARIRRVAGCATPTGSAGHAGATANLKLTFHLDHSAGAGHSAGTKWRRRINSVLIDHSVPEMDVSSKSANSVFLSECRTYLPAITPTPCSKSCPSNSCSLANRGISPKCCLSN